MTDDDKEKIRSFLKDKLSEAKEECGEGSKEVEFIKIAKDVVDNSDNKQLSTRNKNDLKKYFSYHLCPDQYVGMIREKEDWKRFYKRSDIFKDGNPKDLLTKFKNNQKIFLLILESSHKDEYDINHNAIGPAQGQTGKKTGINIRTHIDEIFGDKYNDYSLILMNAIPFQCSLGVNTEIFRDEVFTKAWQNNEIGHQFFEDRLDSLLKILKGKEVVIVNACTEGTKLDPLYRKVCKSITNVLKGFDKVKIKWHRVIFYHIHHPASWEKKHIKSKKKFYVIDTETIQGKIRFRCCHKKDICKDCKCDYGEII